MCAAARPLAAFWRDVLCSRSEHRSARNVAADLVRIRLASVSDSRFWVAFSSPSGSRSTGAPPPTDSRAACLVELREQLGPLLEMAVPEELRLRSRACIVPQDRKSTRLNSS